MHQLVGSENIEKMGAVQKHLHKMNIIKEEYIDYIRTTIPLIVDDMDKKAKKELANTLWELQFGGEKENQIVSDKKAYEDIKLKFKEIITLGGEELLTDETDKIKNFKEWMD